MLTLPPGFRVFVPTESVDGRKEIDGLANIVRCHLDENQLSGSLYVVFTRRADSVRILYWDRDGYVLMMKRLEKGTYRLPWAAQSGQVSVEAAEIQLILEEIELHQSKRRARWAPRLCHHNDII